MRISSDQSLLKFHLESVEAGGSEMVDGDMYEMVGEGSAAWEVSISMLCGTALRRIQYLERQLSRYSMNAGQADQFGAESRSMRRALGFAVDADDVSPNDMLVALARRDARMKVEALEAFANSMNPVCEAQDLIVNRAYSMAAEYRKQAEEPKS